MNRKIILIAGYLASGKSTFALRLAKDLRVPYLIKDTFKSAICANIPITNRDDSRRFSVATFNAIAYVAERMMEAGFPFIIEGNFVMGGHMKANEGGVLQSLIERYGYQPLTYIFWGDTRILCDRYNARENLPERGQANRGFAALTYEDSVELFPPLGEFTVGGRIVKVDTTDFAKVDYGGLAAMAHDFLRGVQSPQVKLDSPDGKC